MTIDKELKMLQARGIVRLVRLSCVEGLIDLEKLDPRKQALIVTDRFHMGLWNDVRMLGALAETEITEPMIDPDKRGTTMLGITTMLPVFRTFDGFAVARRGGGIMMVTAIPRWGQGPAMMESVLALPNGEPDRFELLKGWLQQRK